MYAAARRYEGVTDPAEAGRLVDESFVPLLEDVPGFIAYYWLDAGDGVMASMSVFEDETGAEESVRIARDWVRENAAALLPNPPRVTEGQRGRDRDEVRKPGVLLCSRSGMSATKLGDGGAPSRLRADLAPRTSRFCRGRYWFRTSDLCRVKERRPVPEPLRFGQWAGPADSHPNGSGPFRSLPIVPCHGCVTGPRPLLLPFDIGRDTIHGNWWPGRWYDPAAIAYVQGVRLVVLRRDAVVGVARLNEQRHVPLT